MENVAQHLKYSQHPLVGQLQELHTAFLQKGNGHLDGIVCGAFHQQRQDLEGDDLMCLEGGEILVSVTGQAAKLNSDGEDWQTAQTNYGRLEGTFFCPYL